MPAPTRHPCPICGRDVLPPGQNQPFPFCSPACKLVDLGRWLDGKYRISGPPLESELLLEDDDGRHTPREDE